MTKSDLFDFRAHLKHTTYHDPEEQTKPKAYLVHDGTKDVWLPATSTELHPTGTKGVFDITIPVWLAKTKELI